MITATLLRVVIRGVWQRHCNAQLLLRNWFASPCQLFQSQLRENDMILYMCFLLLIICSQHLWSRCVQQCLPILREIYECNAMLLQSDWCNSSLILLRRNSKRERLDIADMQCASSLNIRKICDYRYRCWEKRSVTRHSNAKLLQSDWCNSSLILHDLTLLTCNVLHLSIFAKFAITLPLLREEECDASQQHQTLAIWLVCSSL